MFRLTAEESLLLQCLSTTELLRVLGANNFFESDYFKRLRFSQENFKIVLEASGFGNPATMQMMLYALLTVPKELLSRTNYSELEAYTARINPLVYSLIEEGTNSTYENEECPEKINYFRHIRNAVAHSKCNYFSEGTKNYVIFTDNINAKQCVIKIESYKIELVLIELEKLIMEYYNAKYMR